jgi:hypothetical protein
MRNLCEEAEMVEVNRCRSFGTWPTDEDYRKQGKIPAGERCGSCQGLGLVRYRFSAAGRADHDYQVCPGCDGSGRKKAAMANLIEAIQTECDRVRQAIPHYEGLGPIGRFGAAALKNAVTEGQASVASGDVTRMVAALQSLRDCAV